MGLGDRQMAFNPLLSSLVSRMAAALDVPGGFYVRLGIEPRAL